MESLTVNPFEYGGVVGADAFCNRTQELADLRRAAENGDRLLVYAERRMGKTSLVKRAVGALPGEAFLPIYVDVWPTSDAVSLAKAVATATVEAAATRTDKALETAKDVVRRLVPSLTTDHGGNPVVQFGSRVDDAPEPILEDALDAPARLAEKRGKRVVVVYDEIQRLAEYGDDSAERLLRSRTQAHEGVAYLFTGSRKHLIREMFMDRGRPLYQTAGHYPIGPIATEHWVPFVTERFERAERSVEEGVVAALCARTEGHPYYTQHLAHALWEITPSGEAATVERLGQALDVVLTRLAYPFTVVWEGMTANQRTLVQGLVRGGREAQVFSSAFLRTLRLAPSSASRAIEGLIQSDVIDRDETGYVVTDRFFRLWVARALRT
ncbi:MAG: ATP-binding protein [Bacteroidota bacterium]